MAEFEAAFPYEETPDQLAAIESVKRDMAQGKPMDRLICGDVGYGKTEVAIRAAFKAVDAGKQVAVLVPTTILAEQHHRSFSRADGRVSVHDRGRQPLPAQARDPRSPRSGPPRASVDILIGTHRILQKDVAFKDLGLVIIDEEQRFGVEDKEWLKTLAHDRRRPDPLGHADSPHPAHEPAGHPRHLQPRDPAARPQGDRDPRHPLRPRDRQAGHPPRAQSRRPDLFRPQPGLRHHDRSPT